MESVDYKREFGDLYRPKEGKISLVDVPAQSYLMLDGAGDPNASPAFAAAAETLYPFSYAIRGLVKDELDVKYVVMPLEGLWWADDPAAFTTDRRDEWRWTLMILQPDLVTEELVERARAEVAAKKDVPALSDARFESYDEGLAAQTLHVGPFSEEGPTVERLHAFVADGGYAPRGAHHEIYLSDMRRTDPERLRTVLRQPVRRVAATS